MRVSVNVVQYIGINGIYGLVICGGTAIIGISRKCIVRYDLLMSRLLMSSATMNWRKERKEASSSFSSLISRSWYYSSRLEERSHSSFS